jgi:lipooligosaccharide transport system permease protein
MSALTVGGSPRLVLRLTDYWVTVFKRTWRGSVISYFLLPFLYLAAMGVGLGGFVDKHAGPAALGGSTYLAFIAPGLLATTAMQTGVFESTYPVMSGFKWHKFYFSMAATPLTAADILLAQLGFVAFRIVLSCGVFLGVMAGFGALHSWWGGLVAVAVSVLLGLAFAAPITGLAARLKNENGFSLIFRLGLLPMFLFSGAFFPISRLPTAVAWLAYVTPVWHGVDLSRMLTLGHVEWWPAVGHVAYILVWVLAGWFYAVRGFHFRLIK